MNKRVLITGVTGFAGSHLAELLVSKNELEIHGTHLSERHLDNLKSIKDKVNLHKVDLTHALETLKVISDARPDIIYHLAASTNVADSFKNPTEVLMNNISSEVNIFQSLIEKNLFSTKVVIISSAHVYGIVNTADLPISEDINFKPDSPYSVSKITQDYLGLSYFLSYKIPTIILRPFNHIGPRLSSGISISRFAKAIAEIEKGKIEPILKVGNLESKRDFTDVRDMVKAYVMAVDKCIPGEAYNIGTGKSYAIKEMLDKLLLKALKEIKVEVDQSLLRPSDIPELRCDSSKFRDTTGWNPEIDIDQTISDLLDYWRKVV